MTELHKLDLKNVAEDRYKYDEMILKELNSGNIDTAIALIRKDMQIIKEELDEPDKQI